MYAYRPVVYKPGRGSNLMSPEYKSSAISLHEPVLYLTPVFLHATVLIHALKFRHFVY
jgi:hypothetical protein